MTLGLVLSIIYLSFNIAISQIILPDIDPIEPIDSINPISPITDQIYCSTLNEDFWMCDNGECIYYWQVGDGVEDCSDGSDEGEGVVCGNNLFQCVSGGCVPLYSVCNLFPDCNDWSDEDASAGCDTGYQCRFDDGKLTYSELKTESENFNKQLTLFISYNYNASTGLSNEQVRDIIQTANDFSKGSGVDIQDNLRLIALLFMNVITVIFIILGLHKYDNQIGFKDLDISYITLLLIVTQHLIITTLNIFTRPVFKCARDSGTPDMAETITLFDLMQYLISTILWLIWLKLSYKGAGNKHCCGYAMVLLTFLVPLGVAISGKLGFIISRYGGSAIVFLLSQLLMPTIWILMVIRSPKTMNWRCSSPLCSCSKCCQSNTCCFCTSIFGLFVHIGCVLAFILAITISDYQNICLFIGGGMWFNPVWLFLNIILLFSSARYTVLVYNIMMLIITLAGSKYDTMCLNIINVQYSVHALLLPAYIIVIFFSIAPLRKWKYDLIQMYLVSSDVMTDIIVIYYFINAGDYIFAILSALFIIIGQIFGSFSEMCGKDKMDHLTGGDKIVALLGFGSPWFIIKAWTDREYALMEHKNRIWQIMFENMPGVALQIYAALTTDGQIEALLISISVTFLTSSYFVWMHLLKFTNLMDARNERKYIERKRSEQENNNNPIATPNGTTIELTVYGNAGPKTPPQDQKVTRNLTGAEIKKVNAIPLELEAVQSGSISYESDDHNAPEIVGSQAGNSKAKNGGIIGTSENKNDDATNQEKKINSHERGTSHMEVPVNSPGEDEWNEDHKQTSMLEIKKLKQGRRSTFVPKFRRGFTGLIDVVLSDKKLYSSLYLFMISDFYIRSMSIILLIALIPCNLSILGDILGDDVCVGRFAAGAGLILLLLIFEFIMNKRMRIKEYQGCGFIFSIFAVSILSSFYTVLSSLHAMKEDKFFGKSVKFEKYLFEHRIRIYLSVLLNVVNVGLFFADNSGDRSTFVFILVIVFFVTVLINYFAVNIIQKYVDPPKTHPFKLCCI